MLYEVITGSAQTYKLNRFDWFPSVHTSYEILPETQLMASYSRRIERPRGRDLDPFETFMNRTTIRRGNPDIKPDRITSYNVCYTKLLR